MRKERENLQREAKPNKPKERNIGIELLRIVSMLMIVILHCLGHGGVLKGSAGLPAHNSAAWFLEIACYGAVNLYALITGYLCIKAQHRWGRILELWLQVFFYSIAITILFCLFTDHTLGIRQTVKLFFPVMGKQYWYFTSYFCLFLFMPFLNILLRHLSKLQHRLLIFTCICAFCIMSLLSKQLGSEVFNIDGGYSFLWLAVLYAIGSYLKLYPEDFVKRNHKIYLAGYLACTGLVWASKLLIPAVTQKLFGRVFAANTLVSYISPFIVLGSVCLFLFFSQLQIRRCKKLITSMASVSFSVYLISEQPYIRSAFVTNSLAGAVEAPWVFMLGMVLIRAIGIYLACSAIDFLRKELFKLARVQAFCEWAAGGIKRLCYRIVAKP